MPDALPNPDPAWAYFLDIDGTLVELVANHRDVKFSTALIDILIEVREASNGALALISGRSLKDIDRISGVVRFPAAGQHGLERRDIGGCVSIQKTSYRTLQKAREILRNLVEQYPQLSLEDKGMSLALHFRQARELEGWLNNEFANIAITEDLRLQKGHCVLELISFGVDKGKAIELFMAQSPFEGRRPVFLGDDLTDEAGFSFVNRLQGLTIKVGTGETCAAYRLSSPNAVRDWLSLVKRPI